MFCPRCRAEYREGFSECYDCKVPLVPQLEPEAKPVYEEFVTVLSTRNPAMLAMARSVLEGGEIRYVVKGESAILSYGFLPALGPVEIQVREDDHEEASNLLRGAAVLEDGGSLDTLAETVREADMPERDVRRISVWDILERAVRTYQRHFFPIIGILLGPFVLLFPLEVWLDRTFGANARWDVRISPLGMPTRTGMVLILEALYAIGEGALIAFVAQRQLGATPRMWAAYRPALRRAFTLIWVDVAVSILWLVPYALVFSLQLHRLLPDGTSWLSSFYYPAMALLARCAGRSWDCTGCRWPRWRSSSRTTPRGMPCIAVGRSCISRPGVRWSSRYSGRV